MFIRKVIFVLLLPIFLSIISSNYLFAQEGESSSLASRPVLSAEPKEAQEPDMPLVIESHARFIPEANAKEQSGDITVVDASQEISYETKAFGKLPIEFALEEEYTGLKNSTVVDLPAHLNGLSMSVDVTGPFFGLKNTYLRVGVSPSFFGDDWDCESSSFRIPVRILGIHKYNDKLILIAGVGIFPDYDEEVVPILGLIYKPNDRLSFNLTPNDPHVSYAFNDRLTLLLEGGLKYAEYEVDTRSLNNVVLKYSESRLGTGFKYSFNKHISTQLSAGVVFNRSIKYKDDYLGKVCVKNAPYCGLRFNIEM